MYDVENAPNSISFTELSSFLALLVENTVFFLLLLFLPFYHISDHKPHWLVTVYSDLLDLYLFCKNHCLDYSSFGIVWRWAWFFQFCFLSQDCLVIWGLLCSNISWYFAIFFVLGLKNAAGDILNFQDYFSV